jgi:hypothetical protein
MLAVVLLILSSRAVMFFLGYSRYKTMLSSVRDVINDYKKGRFILQKKKVAGDDPLSIIFNELLVVGRHLDSLVSSQRTEIEKFNDLYNSVIFSLSSYFLVLDEEEKVVSANDGFFKRFQFEQNKIIGKKIDEIFYFVNARLKGGLSQARKLGKSVVLEKTHLLTLNKISIIADIKISNISIQGKNQIIIIIDDITNKLRKDYQITLMSQISESIQRDAEIDRILYTILTGVTSGTGLGFNRAMLFLLDPDGFLGGKMAVGPDSFEEAIEIWSNISTSTGISESYDFKDQKSGKELLKKVLMVKFPINDVNIFTRSIKNRENIHIVDSWNNPDLDEEIKKLMDVKEFVLVPLIVGNKAIGAIAADNKFNQAPIGNDSIELLSIFASQAALSIESYNSLDMVKSEMQKISERQEAIVESEKLAAVGRIASQIAHEIRNPLVTMGGYARRIMQLTKDTPKNSDKITNAASIILKESERLEKTLSNVMDFSRPSKFIREFNNINDIVRDTVDLLKNLFQEKNINCELELQPDIPLVKSDFNQMKQVMLNLLQNAIDATGNGGTVVIRTVSDSRSLFIYISDTGTGIKEKNPDAIFEPFFTTKVTGVGLGLAIVKKIIKDHDGEIKARNRDERGAEFEIQLNVPG